ncbi:histidinol-phosphate transaminase [Solimonas sp. K1W22B-7]|uniref:histidinol-phosphate transaminase n=1 Tax=Solimonas sp. K1W22B-7 TaxID=2303331 RepID=UPI000E32EF76|nr:histidinol-phosphate transaminase [Solimonas sp. K1W22B-7]AXQ29496.1 histidinol-phosphate transaminase [Solimonas sp. K1W22B-7]
MTSPLLKNAATGVLSLEAYAPGMPIEELQRRLGISHAIKLASNENPLGPSPAVKAAIAEVLAHGNLALYPDGGGFRLKKAIGDFRGIAPECITLGNGSNDIIELLGRLFLGPGRASLFSQHAFAVYPIITQAQSARAVVVPARPADDAQPLGHDMQAFATALKANPDVSLVFIANPNNPTGTWLAPADIEAFLKQVPPQVMVALDLAYDEYMEPALRSPARAWLDQYPNLVLFHTFSKAYGLAGLRVGYSLSSPELADLLNRVRQPFNNNSLALLAAETALADQDHVARSVELNNRERTRLTAVLRGMGLSVLPSQANFIAVGFGRDAAPINQALMQRGVIVRPVASYQMPQFLRFSIGTEAENDRLVAALREILAS